jgi:hypothetical protein
VKNAKKDKAREPRLCENLKFVGEMRRFNFKGAL